MHRQALWVHASVGALVAACQAGALYSCRAKGVEHAHVRSGAQLRRDVQRRRDHRQPQR